MNYEPAASMEVLAGEDGTVDVITYYPSGLVHHHHLSEHAARMLAAQLLACAEHLYRLAAIPGPAPLPKDLP